MNKAIECSVINKMMPDHIDESGEYYRGDTIIDGIKTGKLRQDESSHWYLVPDDKVARFDVISWKMENMDEMSEDYSDYEDELINMYSRFRLSGGIHKLSVIIP